jgi:type IV pilus assembly protein PilA
MPRVQRGFTLIELLIVLGIMGILASVVLVAINPTRQLSAAGDAFRHSTIKELRDAQMQHLLDAGSFAADKTIPNGAGNALPICRHTQTDAGCINVDTLVPAYVSCLPLDGRESNPKFTGYLMYLDNGRVQIVSSHLGLGSGANGGCE